MRETSIINNKMQAHARVCEENIEEVEEKKRRLLKQFCGQRYEFEGSYRKSGEEYQDDVLKDDSPQHKGVKLNVIASVRQLLAVVMEMSAKTCRLAGS